MQQQNERLSEKVGELLEVKKELKIAKKDVGELSEMNEKLEVELADKRQIEDAIEFLRQSNQKVTNRCSELESKLTSREFEFSELEQQFKFSENQNDMLKVQNQELQVEIDRIKYQQNDSLLNMSTLSVNHQMVADMEIKISRLENENSCLRASKNDSVQTVVFE